MICDSQHGRPLCPAGIDAVLRRDTYSHRSPRSLSSYFLSSVHAEVVAAEPAVLVAVLVVEVPADSVAAVGVGVDVVLVVVSRGETLRG